MIAAQLPALQVVVPLLSAPLCALFGRPRLAWWIALVVSWIVLGVSIGLLEAVLSGGTISYAMGNWAPPWGIEYRIDAANAFVLLIVAVINALVVPYARASVDAEIPADRQALFYTAYMLAVTGLLGVAITGDVFNLFVFLEISSLSSYALISMGSDRRALTAAYHYLVLGTIGATFIVIAIGLLYMATGTLNMADLAVRLAGLHGNRTVVTGFVFLAVGVSLKLALFPLHLWLPNAYAYAPSMVTAFLAATATKVSVYVLLRFFFTVFGAEFSLEVVPVAPILMALAIVAMFAASTVAIFQHDVKRMLAYSSVAQIGYIILGIGFENVTGLTAGIVHLFNHAITKGALFMAMGAVFLRVGSVRISDMRGLGRAMPWTMAGFTLAGLSLIGVPLTVGFISKWYLVSAAFQAGMWFVAPLVLASSLLAVIYVWRVIELAYFHPLPEGRRITEAPLSLRLPMWALVAATIYFGVDTTMTGDVAGLAAATLLSGGP